MARLALLLMGALTRSFLVEGSAIPQYTILKLGTSKEDQVKAVNAATDKVFGVAVTGNAVGEPVTVCEDGGAIPVKAAKAIANQNLDLYLDATDTADVKVTDTVPTTPGTYYTVGLSKSTTAAADEYILVFVRPKEVVIE